jgi:shikimate kinase
MPADAAEGPATFQDAPAFMATASFFPQAFLVNYTPTDCHYYDFLAAAASWWRSLDDMAESPNLVLIGYRATGKSSVGRELADRLHRPFVDLDEVLVKEAGCAIADIVAQGGWQEFRRREKELAQRFSRTHGQVLATGGGVILDQENVAVLQENGILIWLKADPEVIRRRLGLDTATQAFRPSLTGADPLAEVDKVMAEREPLYRSAAPIVIDTAGLRIPEVADRVMTAVQTYLETHPSKFAKQWGKTHGR